MIADIIKNLIPAIKIDSFGHCLTLLNLMERFIEINKPLPPLKRVFFKVK